MISTHVVIVNYNAGGWLKRAVESALQYTAGEVTVVDNASCDNSIAETQHAISEQPRLHWLINDNNRGFATANNQVLDGIRADFAVLMNPDCELNADTLEPILKVFEQDPLVGLASCQIYNEDGSPQATSRRRFPTPWSALVRLLQLHRWFPNSERIANFDYGDSVDRNENTATSIEYVEAISGAFMVIRTSALQTVGLLDEDYFMHCEDLDWCKRFALAGFKVAYVGEASLLHAKGVSSAARPIRVLWWLHLGMNRFFNKFYTQQYSWPLRLLVKLGIMLSFVMRSTAAAFSRLFHSISGDRK